jgi:hypothetical protein
MSRSHIGLGKYIGELKTKEENEVNRRKVVFAYDQPCQLIELKLCQG